MAANSASVAPLVTVTASLLKIFSSVPAVGYWAQHIAFRDALVTPAGSDKKDLALAFIDFMTSKGFYQMWVEDGGAPMSANTTAMEILPAESSARTVLMVPENIDRINFKGRLSDEQRQAYLDLWQETTSYFAR